MRLPRHAFWHVLWLPCVMLVGCTGGKPAPPPEPPAPPVVKVPDDPPPPEPPAPQDDADARQLLTEAGATITDNEQGLAVAVSLEKIATAELLEALAGLPQLRILSVAASKLSDSDLATLGELKELEELQLFDTRVGDEGLAHLTSLERLKVLSLSGTRITDAGLEQVARLPMLTRLELQWTDLEGPGLEHLAKLEHLAHLNLAWTAVSDDQLEQLGSLKKLKVLVIEGTDVTDQGIAQLRDGMPKTQVTSEDAVAAAIRSGPAPNPAMGGRAQRIIDEYDRLENDFLRQYRTAQTDDQRRKLTANAPSARPFAERLLALARETPDDSSVLNALAWILQARDPELADLQAEAGKEVIDTHLEHPKLDRLFVELEMATNTSAIEFLDEILPLLESAETQAYATLSLSRALNNRAETSRRFQQLDEATLVQLSDTRGKAFLKDLTTADADALEERAGELLEQLVTRYGDTPLGESTFAEQLQGEYFAMRNLGIGKQAPEIEGEDVDGVVFKLSDFRGKIVVLSFWGNWCPPCRAMYPHERSLVQRMKDKPFVMLGVNSDEDREDLKQVLLNEKITWRSWWDEGDRRGPIATEWNINSWPSIFVIDAKGVIRYKDVREAALDEAVDALLAEMENADAANADAENGGAENGGAEKADTENEGT